MRFWVQAVDRDNRLMAMELEAQDQESLSMHPQLQHCTILQIKRKSFSLGEAFTFKRQGHFQLLLFSRELLALLSAGLSLIEAVETLVDKETHSANRQLLQGLRQSLYQGESLSDAMSAFPQQFSEFYIATIRASERTGDVQQALQRFIRYQEQAELVQKRIVGAMIYPVVLLLVGLLVGLFLMFYVVPRFGGIYEELGDDIPFFSQVLLAWGMFFDQHSLGVLFGLLLLLVAAVYGLSLTRVRVWLMQRILALPAIGEQIHLHQLSRLYRTLGMLLRGGIPMVTALEMAQGLLSDALQQRLLRVVQDIREGQAMSVAMEKYQLVTPVSIRLMRVGERTGEMGEMLERTAEFLDEEVTRWIEWFSKIFEPLIMAVIGIFIGLIVVLMYMPIFELASNI